MKYQVQVRQPVEVAVFDAQGIQLSPWVPVGFCAVPQPGDNHLLIATDAVRLQARGSGVATEVRARGIHWPSAPTRGVVQADSQLRVPRPLVIGDTLQLTSFMLLLTADA